MRKLVSLLTLAFIALSVNGQQLYKCDTTRSFWTFSNDNSFFTIRLSGNAKETESRRVISVNNYVLQSLFVEKVKFIKEGEDNADLRVLVRHAMSEAEYFSAVYKRKINIQLQKAPLSPDQTVLIWFFEVPPGHNQQVKFQLFANIITGDKIFGLAGSQFANQRFDSVKDFLMDAISTLKKVDNKNDLDRLCGQ